ncbi:hypothetical protein SAMN02910298_02347 [Pseudobutyrivibrio sp. YE44]|uniref:hypothetical protein n=1 Tax=Pseudobutyrivibrio sp. YE44 TaxID=1520802 RepID=UPI0008806BED|nr:hypothetical protein [Pseudobutyrivibrio sp. YE44]SDB46774.1 hypothetical protein SAMN02910298_02347 [Pseudobutyrivibrio sp. YE44]
MDIKLFLTKRKRLLSVLALCCFACFCILIAKRSSIIIDDPNTPLSASYIEAMFYVENTDSGSLTCVGDGLLKSSAEISNDAKATKAAIVTAPDYTAVTGDTLKVKWSTVKTSGDEIQVYGAIVSAEAEDTTNTVHFTTLEQMTFSNVEAGTIATTDGLYKANDGGAAKYTISDTPTGKADGVFEIKLLNGKYANLMYDSSQPLNVALFNVFPGRASTDSINTAINMVKGKASGLQFNPGTYYIDKQIKLDSMAYYGNNTTLEVSDNFISKGVSVITTKNTTDDFSIELHGLNLHWEIKPSQTLQGNGKYDTMLMALFNTQHVVIDSCKFEAINNAGIDRKVSLLWFKQPKYIKNVTITNSSFENRTGITLSTTDHWMGGCLWFSGTKDSLCTVDNINISNCNVHTTLADEAICFWFVNATNVHLSDCTISNEHCNNDNVLAFVDGAFNNVSVQRTTFNVISPSMYLTKMGNLWGTSHIKYDACTFNVSGQNLTPYKNAVALFFLYHDKSGITLNETSSLLINNCKFNSLNSTGQYRSIIIAYGVNDRDIHFNEPVIDSKLTLKEAVANFEKANNCNLLSNKSLEGISSSKTYRIVNSNNIQLLDGR